MWLAQVPTIVPDLTAWLALFAALSVVLGAVYGLLSGARRSFTKAVAQLVAPIHLRIDEHMTAEEEAFKVRDAQLKTLAGESTRTKRNVERLMVHVGLDPSDDR